VALFFLYYVFPSVAQQSALSKIDPVIASGLSFTGPAHLILTTNETVLYDKSFFEEGDRITANTRIKISSASIWLVSATILALSDKGYFTLDTEIGKFLPQFKGDMAKITIRQLLSHTSGLPTSSIHLKNRNLTLAQSVDSIAKQVKLLYPPGKTFTYGAVGIQIAARVAEVATNKSWEQIFYEQIARPCQMTMTDFGKAKSLSAADGAYSTGRDYANFLKMLLNKGKFAGTKILSEKMVEEMFTAHTEGLPIGYTPFKFKTSQYSRFYGLGVWIERIDPKTRIGTEVSCQGLRSFTPWLNTCNNMAGVLAVYGDLRSVQQVVDGIKSIISEHFPTNCLDISTENLESLDNIPEILKDAAGVSTASTLFISFRLDEKAFVSLKLYDPLGNEIENLLNKQLPAGEYTVPLPTKDLPPGMYFYRLKVNERTETKKIQIKK
jgi:hypothetical protein